MKKKLTKGKGAKVKAEMGKRRRVRVLLISAAAVLVLALTLGILLLVFGAGRTVMRVGDIKVRQDLYAYWLSYCKYRYLAQQGGQDTAAFWASDSGDGTTNEAACRAYAESYMARIITAASLFEELGGSLSETERASLTERHRAVLRYEVDTKKRYNARAKEIGFDYATLRKALLYEKEAELLQSLLAVDDADLYDYYTAQFRHAYIIEVRTQNKYTVNDEGDLAQDMETGNYLLTPLTEAEKRAAREQIASITASLTADGSLNNFLALYRQDGVNEDINIAQGRYGDGYFFAPNAEFSAEFASGLPSGSDDVVGGILSQEKGSWRVYNAVNSTLIVFVTQGTGEGQTPYTDDENGDFFHDMGADAAAWLCETEVARRAAAVKLERKIADQYSIPALKTDYMLYVK